MCVYIKLYHNFWPSTQRNDLLMVRFRALQSAGRSRPFHLNVSSPKYIIICSNIIIIIIMVVHHRHYFQLLSSSRKTFHIPLVGWMLQQGTIGLLIYICVSFLSDFVLSFISSSRVGYPFC